jgi:hypothetical protein
MPERAERHFAGKVHAFDAGYAKAKDLNPDVIGNLDADVSIEPDHFQYLLSLPKTQTSASADRLSGKDRCSTIIVFLTLKTSGAAANCSGGTASTRSADTSPSKAAASTISRSFPHE